MNTYTKPGRSICNRAVLLAAAMILITGASTRLWADTGTCGGQMITLPFTDVPNTNIFFCSIAEAFFSGLTNGTTATTYSPSNPVPREQMAAFVTRTLDQSLKRGSRRAALDQYWTPASPNGLAFTTIGTNPRLVKSDGEDLWVANLAGTVSRVRASDGKVLETWTGATQAYGVLSAKGLIFVTGAMSPGQLYQIDPTQAAGPVTTLTSSLGMSPLGISFDGARVWTTNAGDGAPASAGISIVSFNPVTVTTVTTGFEIPFGILYDGANMWVTDQGTIPGKLFKLDSAGNIILTVIMGQAPVLPVFDGTNIWVPNGGSDSVMVVRASTGVVLATLSGNGLSSPRQAAFDGERILVTNSDGSASLWKAADLTPLGSLLFTNNMPFGACSDGLNFWITISPILSGAGKLVRF